MSFTRYPEYKDSGVEWLGQVPAHWEVMRLKALIAEVDERAEAQDIELLGLSKTLGIVPRSQLTQGASESDNYEKYKVATAGQLVMNKMQAWNGVFGICPTLGMVSPDYAVFRFIKTEFDEFLCALFRTDLMAGVFFTRCRGMGTAFLRLNTSDFLDIKAPLPPIAETLQIAAFLNRETAKIDRLVVEQQRLIALLKEKRQAVISHAVTRGLSPDAPIKPSGIEWLGDVPAHWAVCSIRRIVSAIEQGWSPECFARPAEGEEWGVLKAGCVNRGTYDQSENKALPGELDPMPEYEVMTGDVLMSRASGSPELVGSTALVTSTRNRLMLSDKIFRFRFDQRIEPRFFVAALNSRPLRSQIEQALSGGNGLANNLPQSSLLGFFLAVPTNAEQQEICAYLESETAKLDTLTNEAQRAIDLLQEHRTALIAAAVTGQIDIRDLS